MRGAKVVFCRERNKYVKIHIFWGNISVFRIQNKEWNSLISSKSKENSNCSNYQLFKSYAMRGAKVVFCRERNKYVKIQIF